MKIKRTDLNFKHYTVYLGPDVFKGLIVEASDAEGDKEGYIIYAPDSKQPEKTARKFGKVYVVRTGFDD